MTSLSTILAAMNGVLEVRGGARMGVRAIRYDSRRVEKGDMFVAVNGRDDSALGFVGDALSRGASAVIVDEPGALPADPNDDVAFVLVRDARRAMAEAAAALYDYPNRSLEIYGVTGTNGKTTTSTVLHQLLTMAGKKAGLIGTLGATIADAAGDGTTPTGYTTPESPELMEIFARMKESGIETVVMEVSSHALALSRVAEVRFAGAAFTNITQDHLDFHTTFEDYLNAKKLLFDGLDADATAVVNVDDPHGLRVASECHARVVRFGRNASADLRIADVRLTADSSAWVVEFSEGLGGGSIALRSPLTGAFNVDNVTAACGLAMAAGLERERLPEMISLLRHVPGRMESIRLENGATAIVDYAHTPDALENLLETVREMRSGAGRLILVFGCGGDRDRGKRPMMGRIASALADVAIVTSDNPRSEEPEAIIDEIVAGTNDGSAEVRTIVDRAEAIATAIEEARPEDIVIVAGKGHENYQIVGDERRHFDDREVIRDYARRAETSGSK